MPSAVEKRFVCLKGHRNAFAHVSSDLEIWSDLTHGHYQPEPGSSNLEISDHHESHQDHTLDPISHYESDLEIWQDLAHGRQYESTGSSGLEISDQHSAHHEADHHHQAEAIPHYSSDLEIWSSLTHPPHKQSDLEIWKGLSLMEQDHSDGDSNTVSVRRTVAPAHDQGRGKIDHSRARSDATDNDILSEKYWN